VHGTARNTNQKGALGGILLSHQQCTAAQSSHHDCPESSNTLLLAS
jgi:hypothetical protein